MEITRGTTGRVVIKGFLAEVLPYLKANDENQIEQNKVYIKAERIGRRLESSCFSEVYFVI